MATDAKYGVVRGRRGVLGDCMSHWTSPMLVGVATAADLLLTGRTFVENEAAALGAANRALPAAEVFHHARQIAHDIATKIAPASARLSKRLLWDTRKLMAQSTGCTDPVFEIPR